MRKIPFAGIELTSQRVRGLRGTSELPGRPAYGDSSSISSSYNSNNCINFITVILIVTVIGIGIVVIVVERLSKLGEKPTFQRRLREEVRLKALAEETLSLHGGGA